MVARYDSILFFIFDQGTTYYVLNFGTFVCSKCAGILRELRFKVKGISVSLFSEEEKNHAEIMGNEKAQKVWMGLFNYKSNPIPKNQNEFKRHLKDKYINKKYFKRNKDIKKVRFDTEESDSDSNEGVNNDTNKNGNSDDDEDENNEDENEDEEDEESEDEADEDNDKDMKEDKKKPNYKINKEKELTSKESKTTPLALIKIKKPHNKIMSESMKFSKKAWEDLWEKADLSKIKQVSINDFEFFDKDNTNADTNTNANSNVNSNNNNTTNQCINPNLLFNSNNESHNFYQPNTITNHH